MSHADNVETIASYCRENFSIGSIEVVQLERAAVELRRLEEALRYWSGYDDIEFAVKQAKTRGEMATAPTETKP